MMFAAMSFAQTSKVSTPNSNDDAVIVGCEKAAKEVVAAREYIAHLEQVKGDQQQTLALYDLKVGIQTEQLEAQKRELDALRESLKAEREVTSAMRAESALKDARIAKLEKRKGGGLKERIITTAIGVGIGAILK